MTASMLKLRDYQETAISKIFDELHTRKRTAVVLPTGAGKTVIFSHLANHWWDAFGTRVLILVHREELKDQTVEKLNQVAPGLDVGVIKAKENDHENKHVIVASVQTLRKLSRIDALRSTGEIGLVIVDECHHATASSYTTILSELGCFDEDRPGKAVGFTATLTRGDSASLASVWESIAYQRDILDMIGDGHLVDVSGKLVTVNGLSLSQVAMSGGDYQLGSLSEALMSSDAPDFVAKAYVEHARNKPGVIFTPTVETAQAFAEALQKEGIDAEPIWGQMDKKERVTLIRRFRTGDLQVLVNCMVLTEGFDAPRAEVVVIARPTTNPGLYVQMVGRVLRPYPDKKSALVLDVVGASEEHRLASMADLTTRRVREIREGETLVSAAVRERSERNPALRDYVVDYRDIDLFQRSRAMWKRTYEGIWFVTTKENVYFLWPGSEADLFHVGKRPIRKRGGEWLHRDVSLELGMEWIETEAVEEDPTVASRNASWRKKREAPSDAMMRYAYRLGFGKYLEENPGVTKRDLSTMMDIKIISDLLDKPLKKARKNA